MATFNGTSRSSLIGGPGDDVVRGYGGFDTLDGGDGDDRRAGGRGDDRFEGDVGEDVLDYSGLAGNGFVFARGRGADTIEAFGEAYVANRIDLSAFGTRAPP